MGKMVNELQGHLHLNVLRMLREPEDSWWVTCAGGRAALLAQALQKATEEETKEWGHYHIMDLPHLLSGLGVTKSLDNPSLPLGGDTNTVNNTSNTAVDDFTSNSSNVSMRSLYDCS